MAAAVRGVGWVTRVRRLLEFCHVYGREVKLACQMLDDSSDRKAIFLFGGHGHKSQGVTEEKRCLL